MKSLLRYVPFVSTIFLAGGILIEYKFRIVNIHFLWVLVVLLSVLYVIKCISRNSYSRSIFYTCFAMLIFIGIGSFNMYLNHPKNQRFYFTQIPEFHTSKFLEGRLKLKHLQGSSETFDRYIAEVNSLGEKMTCGKVLISIAKDATIDLAIDDEIHCNVKFSGIRGPLNPFDFDYRRYWYNRKIEYQLFLEEKQIIRIIKGCSSIFGYAAKFRNRIKANIEKHEVPEDVWAVVQALLLGQRTALTKATRKSFADAGAMHILAVSGLHVGIFVLMLTYLFKPLNRYKYGRLLQAVLVIALLWCFAVIAGLSASVVRAVTMFSFVTIAMLTNRQFSVEQSLMLSMFTLLMLRPLLLFDVGFQLSYSAVFSIIYIQPQLLKIIRPSSWLLRKAWALTSVSIAAQIGVFPLSIYYFNQFPTHFLVSNLLVIPFLGVLLIFGVVVLGLAFFDILPNLLGRFFFGSIELLITSIEWLGSMDVFLVENITISRLQMLIIYVMFISFFVWYRFGRVSYLFVLLLSVLSLQINSFYNNYSNWMSDELIVFHKNYKTIISRRYGMELQVIAPEDSIGSWKYDLSNYLMHLDIRPTEIQVNDAQWVTYRSKHMLLVDENAIYEFKRYRPDIVLLRNSPKVNLDRLIRHLKPELIIADGSNYHSYVHLWENSCKKNKTPFHSTLQKGALIIK